jgi:hypothetical protein
VRLLAAISHHGLGHLAQTAPVLNALQVIQPNLELTIWSGLSNAVLRTRIPFLFQHRKEAADVGLAMIDAVNVDTVKSHAAYLDFHRNWERRLDREAEWLKAKRFQGVFSDVAYLPLAAAGRAEIPGVAMCSLNWRDIAGAYLSGDRGMDLILAQMESAYRGARAFLRPVPAMPMAWLPNGEEIAPITALGKNRRKELAQSLGARGNTKWVLVGFGGIGYRGELPEIAGVTWLVPDDWAGHRADLVAFQALGMPFLDLLASCDALLTKVGYGSFVEAVAHGIPVLYIDRPDWPETPYLTAWLERNGRGLAIDEPDLFSARTGTLLDRLWALPARPRPEMNGAAEAAHRIRNLLKP